MNQSLYTDTNLGLFADWLFQQEKPFLAVVPTRSSAETLYVNLQSELKDRVDLLPDWDINPSDPETPGEAVQKQRISVLTEMKTGTPTSLVIPIRALGHPVLHPNAVPRIELQPGPSEGPRQLASKLSSLGYQRRELVEEPGDYSLRGDLLDFFPETSRFPLRVSFFDREVESLEYFHPSTHFQVDEQPDPPVVLSLQSEFALNPGGRQKLKDKIKKWDLNLPEAKLEYVEILDELVALYTDWPRKTVFPETLEDFVTIGVYRPSNCREVVQKWDESRPKTQPWSRTFRSIESILPGLTQQATFFSRHFQKTPLTPNNPTSFDGEILDVSSTPGTDPNPISNFLDDVEDLIGEADQIKIHCGKEGVKDRLLDLLNEELVDPEQYETSLTLSEDPWHGSYRRDGRARLSLDDFFNRTISRGRIGPSRGKTEYLESFEELAPGDLVVHENFGIGRFHGLKRVSTEYQTRDCLLIQYKNDDRLYLPPDQIAWVQKYVADRGFSPSLSSLGNNQWQRIKENVQDEVSDLAKKLLELYTAREETASSPHPPDTLEQSQFEASFPYQETPDQRKAIQAVKDDLQSTKPMDRLICGDSGFGKTEVALRAAFKVVSGGRQVAMLVPTTVLTRQHYETFNQRFSTFPYRVEMLSRFQTDSESRTILADLRKGDVDVLIGTHSLLSDRIEFNDLGLLIIDEEQRFGVQQKESLKLYRKNVDVLTLSATPIPRTLYMTLSGVQNISRVNTPPGDRVPIQVDVSPYNGTMARNAIDRELSRGGQVFWVYNRVKNIEQEAETVRSLAPNATIGVAHGQMGKSELRTTMNRFYENKIDVLVCTTIIENGLDCPSVNTMIIRNSHMFGLSQLYQLRGRIGRSHKQAHAFLFYPGDKKLTDDAEARLETIKQCSELGSGYEVAMRDMEIRGAGKLLGKKQHGNIRSVGFPFYCRLLQREIRKLREQFEVPEPYPKLKLPGEHYLPENYIPEEKHRIRQYQELASCRTLDEVENLANRWRETFGPLPEPAREVVRRHKFKILANNLGCEDFNYNNDRLNLRFTQRPPQGLIDAARKVGANPRIRNDRLLIRRLTHDKISDWLEHVVDRTASPQKISS